MNKENVQQKSAPSPKIVEGYCYRLRYDSLVIVAAMLANDPNRSAAQMNSLLLGVQERLLEGMFFDPDLQQGVKNMLLRFQAKTVSQRIQDKRGERLRNKQFLESENT